MSKRTSSDEFPRCRKCGDVLVVDPAQDPVCADGCDPIRAAINKTAVAAALSSVSNPPRRRRCAA